MENKQTKPKLKWTWELGWLMPAAVGAIAFNKWKNLPRDNLTTTLRSLFRRMWYKIP